jgi:DNA/RNA endonuclease YhcR with UshA esterase domain
MQFLFMFLSVLSVSINDDVISVSEARKSIDKEVTLKMEVKSSNFLKDRGMCFLNSESDHRNAENFTIVIKKTGLADLKENKIEDPATHYKGKTIVVKGKVVLYNKKPQIEIEKFEQITLDEKVDKKDK